MRCFRCVERIAAFMDISLDADLRATTLKLASFEWMSTHGNQFDDHFVRNHVRDRIGLEKTGPDTNIGKVRNGAVGGRKDIPPGVRTLLERRWKDALMKKAGLADYPAMRAKAQPKPK